MYSWLWQFLSDAESQRIKLIHQPFVSYSDKLTHILTFILLYSNYVFFAWSVQKESIMENLHPSIYMFHLHNYMMNFWLDLFGTGGEFTKKSVSKI